MSAGERSARLRRKCEGSFLDLLRLDSYESREFIKWAVVVFSVLEEGHRAAVDEVKSVILSALDGVES